MFAQHGSRTCQTVAGFRRQILTFDAWRCTKEQQRINLIEVRLEVSTVSIQAQR